MHAAKYCWMENQLHKHYLAHYSISLCTLKVKSDAFNCLILNHPMKLIEDNKANNTNCEQKLCLITPTLISRY